MLTLMIVVGTSNLLFIPPSVILLPRSPFISRINPSLTKCPTLCFPSPPLVELFAHHVTSPLACAPALRLLNLFSHTLLCHSVFKDAAPLGEGLVQTPALGLGSSVCVPLSSVPSSPRGVEAEHVLSQETHTERGFSCLFSFFYQQLPPETLKDVFRLLSDCLTIFQF